MSALFWGQEVANASGGRLQISQTHPLGAFGIVEIGALLATIKISSNPFSLAKVSGSLRFDALAGLMAWIKNAVIKIVINLKLFSCKRM
jgi:hypothetical protein